MVTYAGIRLVDFAAAVAERARLTPAVIALTVVAAGTSMPELVVSFFAALRGSPDIAMGNVVGSNIANIGLILGVCAVIASIPVGRNALRFDYPFLLLASSVTWLLCRDGVLDRIESAAMLAAMGAFTAYSVRTARREFASAEAIATNELSRSPAWRLLLGLGAALVGLSVGASILVTGAVGIAHALGVSERVVGLTIVAVGTSLPELAFSLAAALRKQQDMAVSNVIGSNIFNLMAILGLTGLAAPIPVDPGIATSDIAVMIGFTLALLPLVARGRRLSRAGGALLLVGYAGYLGWLAAAGR